jgi:hypothetical protein
LTAIGAFTAGIACTALVALPLRPIPADDTATTGDATPVVFALASDDKATPGAVDSKPPAQVACEDQVWPRFSAGCLSRNGEPSRPVRLIERNRLAESTPAPKPARTVVRGRETLGIATPAQPQVQAQPEAPVASQAEKPRRAKRSRKSRERDVARTREAPAAAAFNQVGAPQPLAPGFAQPATSPRTAYAPEPTRRSTHTPEPSRRAGPPQVQSYGYPHVQNY